MKRYYYVHRVPQRFYIASRPYGETSQIVDLFCQDVGKVSLVFKGGRSSTRMKRGMAQPFTLLLASYFGRGSLKTVKSLEAQTQVVPLAWTTFVYGDVH